MVAFRLVPKAEVAANHAKAQPKARPNPIPRMPVNLGHTLDLGDTIYLAFRGRSYGVPPVPWKVGQRLVALRFAAQEASGEGVLSSDTLPAYYDAVRAMGKLCWRHCRPARWWQRVLKRVGLARNVFESASEAEIVAIADFFCSRRMTVSVGFPGRTTLPSPAMR